MMSSCALVPLVVWPPLQALGTVPIYLSRLHPREVVAPILFHTLPVLTVPRCEGVPVLLPTQDASVQLLLQPLSVVALVLPPKRFSVALPPRLLA